jgi:antitoxin component of RelBE/YafQ-DinJ toxin-antitoxin module
MNETQISAYISQSTKEQVDRFVDAHGIKKGHLLEQALLHHLLALREIPFDVVLPPQIVVTSASHKKVSERVKNPRKPNKALRDLLSGKQDLKIDLP